MKRTFLSRMLILALGLAILGGCGGKKKEDTPDPVPPTKAALTLSTEVSGAIPAGTMVNSYSATITLPAGVTVKSSVNPPETDAGVVTATGTASGAVITGVYTPATSTKPGTVKVYVASATGFGAAGGAFCTVQCDITAGHEPKAADFTAPKLDDATGLDSSLSTVILTNVLTLKATVVLQ